MDPADLYDTITAEEFDYDIDDVNKVKFRTQIDELLVRSRVVAITLQDCNLELTRIAKLAADKLGYNFDPSSLDARTKELYEQSQELKRKLQGV
jgi:hypothetical protein